MIWIHRTDRFTCKMSRDTTERLHDEVTARMKRQDWAGAIQLLRTRPDLTDSDIRFAWNMGWAQLKAGRFDEAIKHLRVAAELEPWMPTAHWALGQAHAAKDEFEQAERCFRRAIELKESSLGRFSLAFLLHRQGRLEEAEAEHRESVRVRPDERERLEALADFLSDVGKAEEAQEWYERAKALPTREEKSPSGKS